MGVSYSEAKTELICNGQLEAGARLLATAASVYSVTRCWMLVWRLWRRALPEKWQNQEQIISYSENNFVCICVPCSGTSRGYCLCALHPISILITLVMVAQGTEALTHHVN